MKIWVKSLFNQSLTKVNLNFPPHLFARKAKKLSQEIQLFVLFVVRTSSYCFEAGMLLFLWTNSENVYWGELLS